MPSVKQMESGKYRAQVYVNKDRDSKVFRTKREAQAWSSAREHELRGNVGKSPSELYTLGQVLSKYRDEVTPGKRGKAKEEIRINAMMRLLPIELTLDKVTDETIKTYRDQRSKVVKPNSVLRELGTLSSVFEHARVEWKLIKANPVHDVKKPQRPEHRTVTITRQQIRLMLAEMGYSPSKRVASIAGAVAVAFMTSLRTGLRAGEACGLTWDRVLDDSVHVWGKTPAANRLVPITPKARRLIEKMRDFDPLLVFGLKTASLDAMFRKYRSRAWLSGFTYHDSRHTAATWMVQNGQLNVLELCKIFGWTDPKMAMLYFNPKPSDLLKRMSGRK